MEINGGNIMEDKCEILIRKVEELLEFIEESGINDINNIGWLTDTDCYIDGERSEEFQRLLKETEEILKGE